MCTSPHVSARLTACCSGYGGRSPEYEFDSGSPCWCMCTGHTWPSVVPGQATRAWSVLLSPCNTRARNPSASSTAWRRNMPVSQHKRFIKTAVALQNWDATSMFDDEISSSLASVYLHFGPSSAQLSHSGRNQAWNQ